MAKGVRQVHDASASFGDPGSSMRVCHMGTAQGLLGSPRSAERNRVLIARRPKPMAYAGKKR